MKENKNYYKYLDGYRFIAVCLVILTHWLPTFFEKYQISKIGVDMFFVLSGFLITEILLKQKREFNSDKIYNEKRIYFSFYVRRSLRIFRIYFIIIFLFLLLRIPVVKENFHYFFFYFTNMLVVKNQHWIGMFSHLWSLAIEEQFYIFWPLIILSIPFKYLHYIIIIFIGISLIYVFTAHSTFSSLTIFSCLSTLCTGALLAYLKVLKSFYYNLQRHDIKILIVSILMLIFLSVGIIRNNFLMHSTTIIFSFYFIKVLITKPSKLWDISLANRTVAFLGKLSYGLYLYHNFIPWLLRNLNGSENEFILFHKPPFVDFHNGWITLLCQVILLLIVSIISWYFIEKPINCLKKYFNYQKSEIEKNITPL